MKTSKSRHAQHLREVKESLAMGGEVEVTMSASGLTETLEAFQSRWCLDKCGSDTSRLITLSRKLADDHDYYHWLIYAKRTFFAAGFHFQGSAAAKWWARQKFPVQKLVLEIWKEWLSCQNVVLMWDENGVPNGMTLPAVTVIGADKVKYTNCFGMETLAFTPKKQKLSPEMKAKLSDRYVEAIEQGKELVLSEDEGQFFLVLTQAKMGEGFGIPRVKTALSDLATWDLFKLGDWNGAWARKDILRQFKKGHEIKTGDRAGLSTHFFKEKWGKAAQKALKGKSGIMDFFGNFDLAIEHVYMKADFFDPKAMEGTLSRLDRWGGAVALMAREGQASDHLQEMLQAEGLEERALITEFLEQLFNHDNFQGVGRKPDLKVGWDPTVFFNPKLAMAWIAQAYQNGLCGPTTARSMMRLNTEFESKDLLAAHADAKAFTPVFEAKQGMASGDGGDQGDKGGKPKNNQGGK